MNWDQIELKWAAMTHRIRADYAASLIEPAFGKMQGSDACDALPVTSANSQGETTEDAGTKTRPE